MSELELELKKLLIDTLNLEDITVKDIDSDAPLFGDGLQQDSIDALELGIELQRCYGVELDAEDETTREHFSSITSLAKLVKNTRGKEDL